MLAAKCHQQQISGRGNQRGRGQAPRSSALLCVGRPATGQPRLQKPSPLQKTALALSAQGRNPTSTSGSSADVQSLSSKRVPSDASHGLQHLLQELIAGQTPPSRLLGATLSPPGLTKSGQ